MILDILQRELPEKNSGQFPKVCVLCARDFIATRKAAKICGHCSVLCRCDVCGTFYSRLLNRRTHNLNKRAIKWLETGKNFESTCCKGCASILSNRHFKENNPEKYREKCERARAGAIYRNKHSEAIKEHRQNLARQWNEKGYPKINGPKNLTRYNKSEAGRQKSKNTMANTMKRMNEYTQKCDCNPNCSAYNVCPYKDTRMKNEWGWCRESPNLNSAKRMAKFESIRDCNPNCSEYGNCQHKDNRLKNEFGWCFESSIFNITEERKEVIRKTIAITNQKLRYFGYECDCNPNCSEYDECQHKDEQMKNEWGWCKDSPNLNGANTIKRMNDYTQKCDCNPNCSAYNVCPYKDTRMKNEWGWCRESPNLFAGFNREEFYRTMIQLTNYQSVEELVADFGRLVGISGVWCIKCGDQVLDVCETQDIGSEMYRALRRLNTRKEKKFVKIQDEGRLDFVLVAKGVESREERQRIEAQYAHDWRAKYWSPAPGQKLK